MIADCNVTGDQIVIHFYEFLAHTLPDTVEGCSVQNLAKKFWGIEIPPICKWNPFFKYLIGPAVRGQRWCAEMAAQAAEKQAAKGQPQA